MPVEKKKAASTIGRIVGGRRSGIDRRVLTYDWYIPERRILTDRRKGTDTVHGSQGEWDDRRKSA